MQRRNFLKTGSLAGLTLTTLAAGAHNLIPSDKKTEVDTFGNIADDFVLNEVTIDALQQKMQIRNIRPVLLPNYI
ncbi:hypothetical protein JN11_00222 [Mucilaginibacter frigoritolerans]|uniref:Secreted protein n=1 Tax=Mucilaginibacter frigoritolerans TaxID=652788 RepID=A0A562UFJ4_9SPHI|nr:hypothetical protein [Mucilaginibacter frigoritolerans]TWJ04513.1 hypothetical protein JN11_00222 [Mucilaginibacter frigoritolerans]